MAAAFEVRHRFPIGADAFWREVFFDEEFNRRLYLEALGFRRYEVREHAEDSSGVIRRSVYYEPQTRLPEAAYKVVGDISGYTERGEFDPQHQRWRFEVIPSSGKDKVSVSGEFWVEPVNDNELERICTNQIDVRVFGIGRMLEKFLESQLRQGYHDAAAFTVRYLAERAQG